MSEESNGIPAVPSVISFHYDKSAEFRSYHVDGAYGGLSPRGFINMAVYAERHPIPQRVDLAVKGSTKDGVELGEEVYREGKEGVFRELQCNLIMDVGAAKAVHKWLGDKLVEFEALVERRKTTADAEDCDV